MKSSSDTNPAGMSASAQKAFFFFLDEEFLVFFMSGDESSLHAAVFL